MRNIKAIKYARKTNKNNKDKKINKEIRYYVQKIYIKTIYIQVIIKKKEKHIMKKIKKKLKNMPEMTIETF